jgi:hypothetical protein
MAVDPRPVLHGRYRLEELLRDGGHVRVHRAFDLLLQREVLATVSTHPADDVADGARHHQAARLAASLSHHNLVPLLDYQRLDNDDGTVSRLVVLEMAQGQSLRRRLREGVPLTTKQAAYVGFDLAEAFEHLHERGIVLHGLTPDAVFLAEQDDGFLRAQLADLASAVRAGDPTSVPVDGRPTVATWPPERLRGEPASAAGDVFMLGVLVLEALTGRAVFPDPVERAAGLDTAPIVPDGTPDGLAALLHAATATDPADRPGSTELAVGFRRFIAEEFGRHRRLDPSLRSVADEEARLAALHRYDLLDTPPEGAFDRITTLAGRALHMPVSTVSIVDRDRIWFKSHYGLDSDEIGRDPGLCATVVETGAPVYVPDARADPTTRGNPLIAGDLALQSYAGVPLTSVDGYTLGSLSVADYRPRTLSDDELDILDRLGRMITHELEMRLATRRALLSHD